jgi:uracil-DNA glycosylase
MGSRQDIESLLPVLQEVRSCTLCAEHLPEGPRPVFQLHPSAKILVAGQAPGRRVHESGIPFDDPSGDRLREWMGIDRETFYDATRVAILPMAFCYPGTGKSGDLPPRPECADKWRQRLLEIVSDVRLTLVIGQYAQKWHLNSGTAPLTSVVQNWKTYRPSLLPLPHPSPRNNIWLKKNPWFVDEIVPYLKRRVQMVLNADSRGS